MKKNERNAGKPPYYGKGVKIKVVGFTLRADKEEEMKAKINAIREQYRETQNN